jgi:hypothetical protein
VRRDILGALRALVVPTLVLLGVAVVVPGRIPLAIRIYALVVCGAVLVLALRSLRRLYPRPRPLRSREARKTRSRRPPPSLARIEDEAALGVAGAFALHFRLVPRIRSIASGVLSSRRRVSLDENPDAARRQLGSDVWELVRPDHPAPEDRLARGIPVANLRAVVESLEEV